MELYLDWAQQGGVEEKRSVLPNCALLLKLGEDFGGVSANVKVEGELGSVRLLSVGLCSSLV